MPDLASTPALAPFLAPDPEPVGAIPLSPFHRQLVELHAALAAAHQDDDLRRLSSAVAVMLADTAFASWISSIPGCPKTLTNSAQCWWVAERFLYRLLYSRDYAGAALLLWGPEVFDPRPRSCRLIFKALHGDSLINAMGGASSSKTYSGVAWLLLDWVLDPEWTQCLLVGPDHDHLKRNAFGDLIRLHSTAVIPLPGKADTEALSLDKRRGMGFFTVALDRGPAASAKLKGAKTKPRDLEHPLFGRSSRLRILLDEAQQVPVNAWDMLLNTISNAESSEHLKLYCAANPSDEFSQYGRNCKPAGGWGSIDSLLESWVSETGWRVVRLNAMLSENVKSRRVIFPRLISYDKVQAIIKAAGGDAEAASVYTQVYGMFPPQGAATAVIAKRHVEAAIGEWVFEGATKTYFAHDPAYTGDRPATCAARVGFARGWRDEQGRTKVLPARILAIQLDSVGQIARGDTQDMADELFSLARILRLKPEQFAIDRTGLGQGLHDIVRRQWRLKVDGQAVDEVVPILGVHFAEAPTERQISAEDSAPPSQLYDTVASEMWYALARLFELGYIKIGRGVDVLAIEELLSRRGGRSGTRAKRLTVEGKDVYKARGNRSPDFADAVCLVVHCIRMNEELDAREHQTLVSSPLVAPPPIVKVEAFGFVKADGRADPWAAFDRAAAGNSGSGPIQLGYDGPSINMGALLDQRD